MSSPPVLEIDALVKPISDDKPAGVPLPDGLRLELDDLRKEPDPLDPATANRNPDWGKLVRMTSDILATSSKDLLAATRLVEAVTKKEGTPGLRDGLRLLHRLVTDCWDRLHPMPGEGEGFEVREGPLNWLNDVARGARFPHVVTEQPLVRANNQSFSYLDWLRPARKAEFEEAIPKAVPAAVRRVYEDLVEAREELAALAAALDEKMGSESAPDLLTPENETNIGTAINRCIGLMEEVARRRGVPLTDTPPGDQPAAPPGQPDEDATPGRAGPVGVAGTREGLYRQIGQIADALRQLEPHSPIPFLLDRCVKLGALPFPDLMRAIIRENAALDELDRLLGITKSE